MGILLQQIAELYLLTHASLSKLTQPGSRTFLPLGLGSDMWGSVSACRWNFRRLSGQEI